MNTQITELEHNSETGAEGTSDASKSKGCRGKPSYAAKRKSASGGKSAPKSKQDQLVALLSKPNGARVSVISERLGWQAHTVRAAISGLRKRGHEIVKTKSQKTGEMVYAINAGAKENSSDSTGASS